MVNKSLPLLTVSRVIYGIIITLVSEQFIDLSKRPEVVSSRFQTVEYCLPKLNYLNWRCDFIWGCTLINFWLTGPVPIRFSYRFYRNTCGNSLGYCCTFWGVSLTNDFPKTCIYLVHWDSFPDKLSIVIRILKLVWPIVCQPLQFFI